MEHDGQGSTESVDQQRPPPVVRELVGHHSRSLESVVRNDLSKRLGALHADRHAARHQQALSEPQQRGNGSQRSADNRLESLVDRLRAALNNLDIGESCRAPSGAQEAGLLATRLN